MSRKINYTDIPRDGLVLEYLLDGDAKDTAGYNSGTATNVTWDTAEKGYVSEVGSFNGSSSYIERIMPFVGYTEGSISLWFKVDTTGILQSLYGNRSTIGMTTFENDISIKNDNSIRFLIKSPSEYIEILTGSGEIETNKRYNFIVIWDSNGKKIYLNNILKNTNSDTTAVFTQSNNSLFNIGRTFSNIPYYYFNGDIGLFRIYNRALTQQEINNLYQEGLRKLGPINAQIRRDNNNDFPKYSLPNLNEGKVLEISRPAVSGVYYDQTGNGNNGTATNVTDSSNGLNNVMSFNGSSSYITTSNFNTPTGGATFSAWINTSSSKEQCIMDKWYTTGNNNSCFILRIRSSGTIFFIISSDGTAISQYIETTNTFNDGKWHLIQGRFIPGTNVEVFVDGIKQTGTITGTAKNSIFNDGLETTIGRSRLTNIFGFNGYIKDPIIYNRALSEQEIQQYYYSNFILN